MSHRTALALLPLLVLLAAPSRADVIVVDPQGGPGAALLQSALNAAHSGDVVLVKPGDYSSPLALVLPPNKGLALVGDAPGIVLPGFAAQSLAAGNLLLVRGLQFIPAPDAESLPLGVGGNGEVWIEDCVALGAAGWWDAASGTLHPPQSGLDIATHSTIVIARSRFEGGHGPDETSLPGGEIGFAWPGVPGVSLSAQQAIASLFDLDVKGGAGGDGAPIDLAMNGGSGLVLSFLRCVLHGGTYVGGDEGADNPATTMSGPGINSLFAPLYLRGTTVSAGGIHGLGTVAPPIMAVPYIFTELTAPPRFVAIDSPVREFQDANVRVTAQPGDFAWLFVSTQPGGPWMPNRQGVCTIDPALPVLPIVLGAVDPAGALEFVASLPALPPGVDSMLLFAQLAVADAQGDMLLGTASSLVWISASF